MQQEDIERFAFCYLCGKRDKEFLNGKRDMSFAEFDRLTYIIDFFGFKILNLVLWNKYVGRFHEKFNELGRLAEEYPVITYEDLDEELYPLDQWIWDFCNNAPNKKMQKWLLEYAEKVYIDKGWDVS